MSGRSFTDDSDEHTLDMSVSNDNLGLEHDFNEAAMRVPSGGQAADETLDLSASFGALDDATLQRVIQPACVRSLATAASEDALEADEVEEVYDDSFDDSNPTSPAGK